MRQKSRVLFLACCILFSLLSSCSKAMNDEEFFKAIKVKNVVDINQSIMMLLDPYKSSNLRVGELLHFQVLNLSNKNIRFPADANIQVFIWEEKTGDWIELQNNVEYQGKGNLTVPKGNDGLNDLFLPVKPVLENNGKAKTIRVAVTGILVEGESDSDRAVSAYIDLIIEP